MWQACVTRFFGGHRFLYNEQTQMYRDRIRELEQKLVEVKTGYNDNEQLALAISKNGVHELRIAALEDESNSLQEQIMYLQTENESLQKDLLNKDTSLEKISLSVSGIENLRQELLLLKEDNEKERVKAHAEFAQKLEMKQTEVSRLVEELVALKSGVSSLESERATIEDECQILRSECKDREQELQNMRDQLIQLQTELSVQRAESVTLSELLQVQQVGNAEGSTKLEQKVAEVASLTLENSELLNVKNTLESNLQVATTELKKLEELQKTLEGQLESLAGAGKENQASLSKQESVIAELQLKATEASAENEKLKTEMENMVQSLNSVKTSEETVRKELAAKSVEHQQELEESRTALVQVQNDLKELQQKSVAELEAKSKEVTVLGAELTKLQAQTQMLQSDASNAAQQQQSKAKDLENEVQKLQDQLMRAETSAKEQCKVKGELEEALAKLDADQKATKDALDTTQQLLEKVKLDHESALSKNMELEQQAKKSEEKCAQQQLEIGDMTRKYDALVTKCEGLLAQNETLEQDILAVRSAGSDTQANVRQLHEEIVAKQKAYGELQTTSTEERIRLESQLEELSQKLTNATKDYAELRDTVQKTKEELTKKQELHTALEEKAVKQEFALSDALRQQENLQAKYDALATQNAVLQDDLTALRTSSTDSNAELVKLSQTVASKQKAYEELVDKSNSERAALESQLQTSQQRVDALCNQVETLTQELKITTEENFKHLGEYKTEQEKCGKQALELSEQTRKLESLTQKCNNMETQNTQLQKDLAGLRNTATGSNAEVVKLTEKLSAQQKTLQELTDKTSAERLQLKSRQQELEQRLEASQNELEALRTELRTAKEAQASEVAEFECIKAKLQTQAREELEVLKAREQKERNELLAQCETQLHHSEQMKLSLNEAISNLQHEIERLQNELQRSHVDFKEREATLSKQINDISLEKERLSESLKETKTTDATTLQLAQDEKNRLLQEVQKLTSELQEQKEKAVSASSEVEQLKIVAVNAESDVNTLKLQLKTMESALELLNAEIEHRGKVAEDDNRKMSELKEMLQSMQSLNSNISATNRQLSEALEQLEHEKCETANIFELFELESDQNMAELLDKLTGIKQQLTDAQSEAGTKSLSLEDTRKALEQANTQLEQLSQTNEQYKQSLIEKDTQITAQAELAEQLTEYRNIVQEMDDSSLEANSKLRQLEERVHELETEKTQALEQQKALQIDCASAQRKLEVMDLEKTREIVSLQGRINDLQSINKLKTYSANDAGAISSDTNCDNSAHINFLNSIIADMQMKNDAMKTKIAALESLPTDYTQPNAFELIAKRKPAPRVFCDICDEFDKHETEDCPLQASDDIEYSSEANNNQLEEKKERKIPEPRKYCESCEVFGHATGECEDECY